MCAHTVKFQVTLSTYYVSGSRLDVGNTVMGGISLIPVWSEAQLRGHAITNER